MRYADACVRNQTVENLLYVREFLHLVMKEEHLAAPVEFVVDDAPDLSLVEKDNFRLHRDTVRRRGVDYAEVPRTQKRELQGPGDRGGGQGEGIHRSLYLPEALLGGNPEFLLFIYHQQAQVLEIEAASKYLVGADNDIYLAGGNPVLDV